MISVPNVDERLFTRFRIEAKRRNLTIGKAVEQALAQWMLRGRGKGHVGVQPLDLGPGSETLSQDIDGILYG